MALDQRTREVQRGVTPGTSDRRAGNDEQRRDAAMARKPDRALQQPVVGGIDESALQPHAGHLDVLPQCAVLEGLAGVGQPERSHVPADQLGARRDAQGQPVLCAAAAVADGFERQPLEPCAGCHVELGVLQGSLAFGAVEARRARRGDEPVAARRSLDADVQHVAAHEAARRMHQHVVAHRVAFGVEALEDAQRTVMAEARNAALVGVEPVVEVESRVPGHGPSVGTYPPRSIRRSLLRSGVSSTSDSTPSFLAMCSRLVPSRRSTSRTT